MGGEGTAADGKLCRTFYRPRTANSTTTSEDTGLNALPRWNNLRTCENGIAIQTPTTPRISTDVSILSLLSTIKSNDDVAGDNPSSQILTCSF